ncbi:MAG: glutamyl-tRNA reductase [Candidatus Omnitrophica bacterium]|nr:glutamyl-tRNA reductase [Candidatus Omnitrophota bacterium]
MKIRVLGLNHKTAPIEIREKLSFPESELSSALSSLLAYPGIMGCVILSTCNRTEIYAAAENDFSGEQSIRSFLSEFHEIDINSLQGHFYSFAGEDAVRHLFRVVSSLDSMIVGETQIFGQVKSAYFKALETKTAGKLLNIIFHEAIKVGKKVRTHTEIGKGAVSVSSAAFELGRKIFSNFEQKKVLIIGAGKIGEMMVKNLYSKGITTVIVANRTLSRAQELAGLFGGRAIGFENIFEAMNNTDIIISSTSAPHYVIKKNHVQRIMENGRLNPLLLLDLGVPRNIDPEVALIDRVHVYNIDDLDRVRDENMKERLAETLKAEQIIQKCLDSARNKINLNFSTRAAAISSRGASGEMSTGIHVCERELV